ncbi:MAG: transglycosylase SLT domain-containing protein [Thermodesulfobacteriota bacterium]
MSKKSEKLYHKISIFLLILILFFLIRYLFYLKLHYWDRESIRVVCAPSQIVEATLSPFGPGLEKESVMEFCRRNKLHPEWKRAANKEQALKMLEKDQGDLAVGFFVEEKDKQLDYIRVGPAHLGTNLMLVHNKYRYALRANRDLCESEIIFLDQEFMRRELDELQKEVDCKIKLQGPVDNITSLFSALNQNKVRFGLTDKVSMDIWHPFFSSVRKSRVMDGKKEYAWIWSRRFSDLDSKLMLFNEKYFSSAEFKRLKGRYLGFLPEKLDHYQIYHFYKIIEKQVSQYHSEILRGSSDNGMDPLFLVAQIYQESHFDPVARSRTGVRGLLQISQSTANELGVNRLDPKQSVLGGAKYMGYLWDQVGKRGVRGWDRWFMSLAAYNQGMSHLWDAMQLAREMGKNSLTWQGVKQVYPLLSYKKYYTRVPNGYCRGFEVVDYVQSIKFYYYILHGLVFLDRPEVKNLGRLAGSIPRSWP